MTERTSLDTLCAALCYAAGIDVPEKAQPANKALCEYIDNAFDGKKADRIFMYNPDAIAQWVYEKYKFLLRGVPERCDIEIPFSTVMPSVTPVCFGTMYTGVQPEIHGIRKYEKPVLKIDTIFDMLIKAGKKVAVIAEEKCSIANIFLEREMDYFIYKSLEDINAKACELIIKDEYDFIVVYNGNYDSTMHRYGTESFEALSELRANGQAFATFDSLICEHWKKHNVLIGFAMDHGCHDIDGNLGSHGLDMDEDINITHLYKAHPAV